MIQRMLRTSLILSVLLFVCLPCSTLAEGPHRAGLIVVYAPNNVYSTCVTFSEPELTGAELLRRAGLRVVGSASPGMGEAICKIENTGCDFPAEDCFCQCSGAPCTYWSYWYWEKGTWVYSGKGAGSRKVRDGDIDAWVWGDGKVKPPMPNFGSCVSLAVRTPTAMQGALTMTSTATSTPQPTETNTPLPTVTAIPQQTNTPLAVQSTTATHSPTKALVTLTPLSTSTPVPTPTILSQTSPSLSLPSSSNTPENQASGEDMLSSTQQHTARRGYGAFIALVVVLLVLIGCAVYIRKRRSSL